MDTLLADFVIETTDHLADLQDAWVALQPAPGDLATRQLMFRLAHTIKGNCGFLALGELEAAAHNLETALADPRASALPVAGKALDALRHAFGRASALGSGSAPAAGSLQSISKAWSRLPSLARSLAGSLAKPIELDLKGEDIIIDTAALALIRDPLTQLVRNAAAHGIEAPAARKASGKPAAGRITVAASRANGEVRVTVTDDGAGLDTAEIGRQAVLRGLATEAEVSNLTPRDVWRFIFMPGLSTSGAATRISGRGYGMDIVKDNIDRLGGTIELDSQSGSGTSLTIILPVAT